MTRLAAHRNVERGRGAPILLRALFAAGVVALIGGVAWVANGGVGFVVGSLTSAVSGVVTGIVATPAPTDSPVPVVADAPEIAKPENPYTNGDTIDVTVAVPPRMAGQLDHEVRLWLALDAEPPLVVAQGSVGATATVVLPDVPLVRGKNPFYATIQGPSTESEPSPTVIWVQDLAKPRIDIASPEANQLVNGETVTITGKTQGRSKLAARNEASGRTVTGSAKGDGTFALKVPLVAGTNGITLTITDLAGNANKKVISVRKGSGKLTVSLTANGYRFRASRLPVDVQFVVTVVDPDGRPVSDATALFTVTIPGLEPIVSSELTTGGDGTAVFRSRISRGATPGSGLASVLVTTREHGRRTDRQVLTINR